MPSPTKSVPHKFRRPRPGVGFALLRVAGWFFKRIGLLLAHSPKFQAILDIAEQQIREDKGMKHDDFWREIESEMPKAG